MWEKLRKFGLQHCDLPTMLWNVAFMLKAFLLNIDNRSVGRIPTVFYITTPIFIFCYLYTYLFSMIWFVFIRCIETRDLTAAMIVFPLGITSEIGVAKFINTCFYRKRIRVLLQEYLDFDRMTKAGSRFSRNLLQTLRTVKKRALIYGFIIMSNGVIYILKPLMSPGRQSMEDIFTLYKLEPTLESPNYELAYIFSATGSCLTCYLTSNMAAFLIIIAGYVEAQLLALSTELFHLWDDAEQEYLSEGHDTDVSRKYNAINKIVGTKLRKIIKSHITALNLLLQVENIFRGAFAFEFLILSVGLIAELLGGLENTYMEVPFAIIQVSMDCLTGQRVIDACGVFEQAVYACNWERFDADNMKTVLVMLMNSQKTLTLSAGGLAVLSFTTLMSVTRSVYSAFTTLQSVV